MLRSLSLPFLSFCLLQEKYVSTKELAGHSVIGLSNVLTSSTSLIHSAFVSSTGLVFESWYNLFLNDALSHKILSFAISGSAFQSSCSWLYIIFYGFILSISSINHKKNGKLPVSVWASCDLSPNLNESWRTLRPFKGFVEQLISTEVMSRWNQQLRSSSGPFRKQRVHVVMRSSAKTLRTLCIFHSPECWYQLRRLKRAVKWMRNKTDLSLPKGHMKIIQLPPVTVNVICATHNPWSGMCCSMKVQHWITTVHSIYFHKKKVIKTTASFKGGQPPHLVKKNEIWNFQLFSFGGCYQTPTLGKNEIWGWSDQYYRKRGSVSYIVREWLLWVVERERETPVTSIDITLKSRVIMHMITSTARRERVDA